jgi:mono/diheme cytochrome c family protein
MKSKVLGSMLAVCVAFAVAQPALSAGDDVADGHRYFVRYCASCHGTDGVGDGVTTKKSI